jgi:hypothetical protein
MLPDNNHGMEVYETCSVGARELADSRTLLLFSEKVPSTRDIGIEVLEDTKSWESPTVVEFFSWTVAVLASWTLIWRLALDAVSELLISLE